MFDQPQSVGDCASSSSGAQTGNNATPMGGACPSKSKYGYVPGLTLGRSGYVPGAFDALADRVEYLDALLCLVTLEPDEDESSGGFRNCNEAIQQSVMRLASHLAHEANESLQRHLIEGLQAWERNNV